MNYFEVLKLSPSEIQGQDETTIKEKVEKAYLDLYSKTTGSYANVPRPDGRTQSQWQTILNKAKDILLDPAKREEHLEEVSGGAKEIVEAPPLGPIAFGGARYETPAELGMALARDWSRAESFWRRRSEYVCNWVIDELGLQSLGDELRAIDDKKTPLETQVFNLICQLAPNVPTMRFRDVDLSMEGLVALGGQAANGQDAGARATLLTLYKQKILLLAGSRPGKEALAEVAHRWDEAVSDYKRLQAECAQDVAVPELDYYDDVLVVLLAGSVPASRGLGRTKTGGTPGQHGGCPRVPLVPSIGDARGHVGRRAGDASPPSGTGRATRENFQKAILPRGTGRATRENFQKAILPRGTGRATRENFQKAILPRLCGGYHRRRPIRDARSVGARTICKRFRRRRCRRLLRSLKGRDIA